MQSAIEILKNSYSSKSVEDTESIARKFVQEIAKDSFIALRGDLGSGKTAFVKGMAKELGITKQVKSPSFNVCYIYKEGLVHIDAYRVGSNFNPQDFLIDELAANPTIICVEWPDMIADFIPENAYKLSFSIVGKTHIIKLD